MEKDKLHAKKQALQKKEKDGRLAELKMFHQTFKLNVPIPADLVPLLSKGKKATDTTTNHSSTPPAAAPAAPATTSASSSPATVVPEKKKPVTTTSTTTAKSATPSPVPAKTATTAAPVSTPPVAETSTKPSAAAATTASDATGSPTASHASSFKFNVKASSFKPNPAAAAFVPGGLSSGDRSFGNRQTKKHDPSEHLTMTEAFVPTFIDKDISPSSVGPTWPFGNKSYRVQFSQYAPYEEDVFTGYPSPNYGYGYPQYRYPQYVQGMPPMAVQQGPYMNPQFVQNVPISAPMPPNGGPPNVGYSPQMANVSPRKCFLCNLISF